MTKQAARIVAIGSREAFPQLFDYLEAAGGYRLEYAAYPVVPSALRQLGPDAVLLLVPDEKAATPQTLAWIEGFRGQVPVVVLSPAADMSVYLAAMTHGAFDYITGYTQREEVSRVLNTAVRWRARQAA